MQTSTTAKVEFVPYLSATTGQQNRRVVVSNERLRVAVTVVGRVLTNEGWRVGRAKGRAIYRLPLIEDDDLTRSYNRLGCPESQ